MLKSLFEQWFLGLYLGSNCWQAVLLQHTLGRVRWRGCWQHAIAEAEPPAVCLQAFVQSISASVQAELGGQPLPSLVVNLGLPHQHCAWQPLPDGGPVMWQRQAAMHWQVEPAHVYIDVLPIAPSAGLLISTPSLPLADLFHVMGKLQPVVSGPLRFGLETDVSAVLKLWPWRMRQHIGLGSWQASKTGLLVDAKGLHGAENTDLLTQCGHYLHCDTSGEASMLASTAWRWQVKDGQPSMMLAWHLAYRPGRWSMPWQAWQRLLPLSTGQCLSLLVQAGKSYA
ncbi:MAG TPA: hypothetical protein DE179_07545 [Oceanospirillaceae bacterium]|nr:hypothetical protein [Oceanospirillaceae bacterium]